MSEPTEPLTPRIDPDNDDALGVSESSMDTGRYRPIRPHARGGLGEVLVAEDTELGRLIALKRIQSRWADQADSRARFVREAEITGRLEHPSIVPIYGLGCDPDGRPFYAMRFIRGTDLFAALMQFHVNPAPPDEKNVIFRDLLARFVAVCQAVAYAHSRGVLHRDLKPANVMLGRFGETLVVDWGLAKIQGEADEPIATEAQPLLSGNDSQTVVGDRVGTPAYMSPEQAAGNNDAVGPASDVYSLGATLYEILTGRLPIDGRNPGESIQKSIRGDWLPPRTVKPDVPRSLDAVCRKAMARLPADRYATAQDLADDVQRWLAGEPVTAWAEPWTWKLGRWLKRHRTVVIGSAVLLGTVLLALAVGLAAVERERRRVVIQEQETARQRDEARRQRLRTREALDNMTSQVTADWLRSQKQLLPEQKRFLQKALEYYREFAAEAADDEAGRRAVADAAERVGSMFQNLGQFAESEAAFRQAAAAFAALTADFPRQRHYRERLALTVNNLGVLLKDVGRRREAEAEIERAVAEYERLVNDFPDADSREALAKCLSNQAVFFVETSQFDRADPAYRRAIPITRQLVGEYPGEARHRHFLAGISMNYAILLSNTGRNLEATRMMRQAVAQLEEVLKAKPDSVFTRRLLADCQSNLAVTLSHENLYAEAEAVQRQALAQREKLAAAYPSVPEHRKAIGDSCNNLTTTLAELKRFDEADAFSRRSLAVREELVRQNPGVQRYFLDLNKSYRSRGLLMLDCKKYAEALPWFDRVIAELGPVVAKNPNLLFESGTLSDAHSGRGKVLDELGRHAEAISEWGRVIELQPERDYLRAEAQSRRAVSRWMAGDRDAAVADAGGVQTAKVARPVSLARAASVLAAAGEKSRALTLLRRAAAEDVATLSHIGRTKLFHGLVDEPEFVELLWGVAEFKAKLVSQPAG